MLLTLPLFFAGLAFSSELNKALIRLLRMHEPPELLNRRIALDRVDLRRGRRWSNSELTQ